MLYYDKKIRSLHLDLCPYTITLKDHTLVSLLNFDE